MTTLNLSIMYTNDQAIEALRLTLNEFEQQHNVTVNLQVLSWGTAWPELVKMAIYKTGPDISEVGTTWARSFVSTHALRPFAAGEIESFGGSSIFLPAVWPEVNAVDAPLWSVPYLGDTRLIYYRQDVLQQAGINDETAFSSLDQFAETLDRLQESGLAQIPIIMPIVHSYVSMHIMASWVWANKGQFLSPGGKHVLFHMPEARRGMAAYFNMGRYFSHVVNDLGIDVLNDDLFVEGKAAILISGTWVLDLILKRAGPDVVQNFAMAVMPEAPFVGGTNLVIWRHTSHAEVALELVNFLISKRVQQSIGEKGGLPIRLDTLNVPPFSTDPHYQVIAQSLKAGRTFPDTQLWGLVEDKLAVATRKIWGELMQDPDADPEQMITKYMDPLAKELNHALAV
jgi:multiple sugar transport system substrate-binding protein